MMKQSKRKAIRAAVRKHCREYSVSAAQLADDTGLSKSSLFKMLSTGNKSSTKTINTSTAEILELWLDVVTSAPRDAALHVPSEGKSELRILSLENEIDAKDRAIREQAEYISELRARLSELQGRLSMEPDDAYDDGKWRTRHVELKAKYNATLQFVAALVAEEIARES